MKRVIIKRRLKRKYRLTLLVILALVIISGLLIILKKTNDDFMKGCQSQGYSYEYCVEHR